MGIYIVGGIFFVAFMVAFFVGAPTWVLFAIFGVGVLIAAIYSAIKDHQSFSSLPAETQLSIYEQKEAASKNKDASVVGRAVAGGIIAGPAGAVVGALSAVDKNNKNAQQKK